MFGPSNTTGNLGPANSLKKDHMALLQADLPKRCETSNCIPGCQRFLFQCLARHVGILPFGGGSGLMLSWSPDPGSSLPPHQSSARPVQEAKMHVLQVAHCKLDIMMIIKNVSTVQFHSLCSSYRPRPLPREFPHANLPLI